MTDQPSETGHLTPEQLDELTVQPAPQPLLERHLANCAACRTALAEQVAVRRLLQQVPAAGPMPADVVARLDSALAGARTASPAPATVLPMHPRDERTGLLGRLAESRVTKSLVAAAAVALIGVGGYAAIQRGGGSTAGGASASSAGDASGGKAAPQAAGNLDQVRAVASGSAYTTANIALLLRQRLPLAGKAAAGDNGFEGSPTAGSDGPPTKLPASTLGTTAGLQACLGALGAPTSVPQLVDLATFDGKPAAVLVLPKAGGGQEIWVVSRTCSPGHDGTLYYAPLK